MNREELIAAKKAKTLERSLMMDAKFSVKASRELCSSIIDGKNITQDNAFFVSITEDDKEKFFLRIRPSTDSQFGTDMARILSNKEFALKRQGLLKDAAGEIYSAIKWDAAISGEEYRFLNGMKLKKNFDNPKFAKKYARLCGVLHVLGERDYSGGNFFSSRKTNNPVKIDNSFLINDDFHSLYKKASKDGHKAILHNHERYRIYGSAQSQYLLRSRFSGRNDPLKTYQSLYQPLFRRTEEIASKAKLKILNHKDLDEYADLYLTSYADGIDENLLTEIRENILKPKNQNLKEEFIEFMRGVKDTIALANDDVFLDDYTKKYDLEIGKDAYKIACKCREFFKTNVARAQEQLGGYLQLFEELVAKEAATKTRPRRKLPATPAKKPVVEKVAINGEEVSALTKNPTAPIASTKPRRKLPNLEELKSCAARTLADSSSPQSP